MRQNKAAKHGYVRLGDVFGHHGRTYCSRAAGLGRITDEFLVELDELLDSELLPHVPRPR